MNSVMSRRKNPSITKGGRTAILFHHRSKYFRKTLKYLREATPREVFPAEFENNYVKSNFFDGGRARIGIDR